jgi:hypothetical protein
MNRVSLSVKTCFFAILLLANGLLLFAQNSDWGLWTSIDAEKKLPKNWELDIGAQYRWKDNISVTDQIRGSADITRKFGNYVKLGAGYELIAKHKVKKDIFVNRNRFRVQATGSYKYARFTANWRTRMQLTLMGKTETDNDSLDNDNQKWVWRNRFGLKYNIKKSPFEPYINIELFHQLFSNLEYPYYRNRFSAGTDYKINKSHSLEIGYKLENEVSGTEKYKTNVVKFGYTFSF